MLELSMNGFSMSFNTVEGLMALLGISDEWQTIMSKLQNVSILSEDGKMELGIALMKDVIA